MQSHRPIVRDFVTRLRWRSFLGNARTHVHTKPYTLMLSNRSTRYIERVLFFLLCQKRHLYLWSTRFDHSHRSVFATCSHRMHSWLAKLILRFKIHSVTFFYCVASFFTWIESEIGCYRTFTKSNVDKSQYEKNADTSIWLQKKERPTFTSIHPITVGLRFCCTWNMLVCLGILLNICQSPTIFFLYISSLVQAYE